MLGVCGRDSASVYANAGETGGLTIVDTAADSSKGIAETTADAFAGAINSGSCF